MRLGITTRNVIRAVVCVHAVALLLLPKDSFGLIPYRPEDVTAVLLLALFAVLALSGTLEIPGRAFMPVLLVYLLYLLAVLVGHDLLQAQLAAFAFWLKEVSYIVFGYLVWRAYRDAPQDFVTALAVIALPNIAYGVYQLASNPRGIYGLSPFGHDQSPASSGMIYLFCAMVMFTQSQLVTRVAAYRLLLVTSLALVVGAGSKIAVTGSLCFFGWYLLQVALERKDARSIRRIGWFGAASAAALVLAVYGGERLSSGWHGLGRYRGLLQPIEVLATRGIWFKIDWIDDPLSFFFGIGYSRAHLLPNGAYSFRMSMDNQALFYLVTGGVIALILYVLLMTAIYFALSPLTPEGKLLRSLVVAFGAMGLGGEVLQLSIYGNAFWLFVGVFLACGSARWREPVRSV